MDQEFLFKFIFFLAVMMFCALTVGIFLVFMKVILLFLPEIKLMGMVITFQP